MTTIGERIKKARINRKMSLEDVARPAKISRQTIYKYETGIISNIPSDRIEKLSSILMVSPAYLMGWEDEPDYLPSEASPAKTKKIPLLGEIACGQPIYADEQADMFVDADESIKADFCLTARGDSMTGARIYDGDTVFIRKQPQVDNGDIAAVLIGDEVTLKRVHYDRQAGVLLLLAENPAFPPLIYKNASLGEIRILGKAVCIQTLL